MTRAEGPIPPTVGGFDNQTMALHYPLDPSRPPCHHPFAALRRQPLPLPYGSPTKPRGRGTSQQRFAPSTLLAGLPSREAALGEKRIADPDPLP